MKESEKKKLDWEKIKNIAKGDREIFDRLGEIEGLLPKESLRERFKKRTLHDKLQKRFIRHD